MIDLNHYCFLTQEYEKGFPSLAYSYSANAYTKLKRVYKLVEKKMADG
jgi:hypothetical protein